MERIKKLSLIVIVFSIILQPFISLPLDAIAEGLNDDSHSVTVDEVTVENESGEALSELENEGDAKLALSWQKTEGEIGDSVHIQLPESLSIHSISANELIDTNGENVGSYELISDHEVRLNVSAADAREGKLSLPVTIQSEETGEQTLNIAVDGVNHPVNLVILPSGREVTETAENNSDEETEQSDDEDDPEPEGQVEETSEDTDSSHNAFGEEDAEETENSEDDAQLTTFDVGVLENGEDLGNIFTFASFTLDGEEIAEGEFLDIDEGTTVQLEYAWDTSGLNALAGDTASIQLPEVFNLVNITGQPIETADGTIVGTYSIIDGEVTFVFNEAIEDGAVNNGVFGLNLQFDLEQFEENIEQVIEFNDRDETTLTVRARPDGEVSGINKQGRPDRNPNAREIIWEIDVINATEDTIINAVLEDIIPDGLGEARDFVIHELSVGINGNLYEGETVDVNDVNPEVDGNGFTIEFDELGPYQGYRVEYRTSIENFEQISFTNDAEFSYGETELPAEATVSGLERSNPVQKNGSYNSSTGQIHWEITVNESGDIIDEAIVYDELPDQLSLVDDSIVVRRFDDNMQNEEIVEIEEADFPINLGSVAANEIYRINFVTDIDWSEVNDGDYQEYNEFTNETNLTDGETPLGNDNATVDFRRESLLEKSGVSNVDYDNDMLTWTITVNEANHPLGEVLLTDVFPDGLVFDGFNITDENGEEYSPQDFSLNLDHEDGTEIFINLGNVGTQTLTIEYRTRITDFAIDNFTNAVGIEGDGIGEEGNSDEYEIQVPPNSFGKSFESIDYAERTIDWSLRVDPIREPITELTIVDTFPYRGLILLPESLEVTIGENVFSDGEGFTLTPNEEDGYDKGFTLEFDSGLLPLNDEMTIVYRTSYDPQYEVDGHTLDPHTGDDEFVYQNDAQFIGNTADNNPFDERESDTTTVREDSWNSGYKRGDLIHEDEEGNLVEDWTSGSERKIAWELYFNYLQQNLGTDVTITDTLAYGGTIDEDSITVSVYDVNADGGTDIVGPELNPDNYQVEVYTNADGYSEFTLEFIDDFVIDERYVIEFTTTVPDISQPNYTNNAVVSVGDDDYPYSGPVNYDRHDQFLEKGAIGLDGGQVFTGDEVEWNVRVNESLSIIHENVVITDTISEGLVYLEDSLSIVTDDGRDLIEGEEEDYTLDVTETEDGETVLTIELNGNLSETLVLNYTTVVTETDGEVSNAIELSGENIETETVTSEQLNAQQFSWVGGNYNPNRGAIRLEKFDADEEVLIENNEATFELWFDLNDERVQYTQVDGEDNVIPFTTENGVLEIGNLPLRTYYLTEVESPEGYVLSDEEIEFEVDTVYGSEEFTHEVEFENTKEQIDVTGTKVWEGGEAVRPNSIELQLYRDDETVGDPVTLDGTEESPWEYTWPELDRTDIDGNEYEYRVEEVTVPENFESTVSEDGQTVTNLFVSPSIDIPVEKVWEDEENQHGIRPDSIEVALFANGEETDEDNLVLDSDSDWQGQFTELPEFDSAGEEIIYTIEEVDVPEEYDSAIDGRSEEGYTITNTLYLGSVQLEKVDTEGNSLEGAIFAIETTDGTTVQSGLVSDEAGIVYAEDLIPGDYFFVETQAPDGYLLNEETIPFTIEVGSADEPVVVEAGELTNYLGSAGWLKVDEEGDPLEGAVFNIVDEDDTVIQSGLTSDEAGIVYAEDLAPGGYFFVETQAPAGYVLNEIVIPFTIDAEAAGEPATVDAEDLVNYQGSAEWLKVDEEGEPLEGAVFSVLDADGTAVAENSTSDEDGVVTVTDLAPGTYTVVETEAVDGYLLNTATIEFTIVESALGEPAVVEAENFANYQGKVQLFKTNEAAEPLEGALFRLESSEEVIEEELTTNEDGVIFVEGLAPGDYTFVEVGAPEGYITDIQEYDFTIEAEEDGEPAVVIVGDIINFQGSVSLQKVDIEGNPLAGAIFEIRDEDGLRIQTDLTSDENGTVTAEGLAPGEYVINEVAAPAGYVLNTTSISFTVDETSEGEPELISLGQFINYQGSLEILKTDENGNPLQGAEFSITDENDNEILAGLISDEAGIISVEGLAPGTYQLIETQAPTGYVLSDEIHAFEIQDEAEGEPVTVYLSIENIEEQEDPEDPEEDPEDEDGVLPQTNESSTNQLYIIGGILLVALGGTMIIVEKKTKRDS